jgi:CheY-like chemotaxis protein
VTQTAAVLVVDDDPRVRSALSALVEGCPQLRLVGAVGTAEAALAACAWCDGGSPALALVDLMLPDERSGTELVTRLRALGVVPIALSVRGGLREAALAAGAVDFLEKGGAPDDVLRALLHHAGLPADVTG